MMCKITPALLTLILSSLLVLTGCSDGKSRKGWSSRYAHVANELHKQNVDLGCGFTAERWHADIEGHEKFAQAIGREVAKHENIVRQVAIDQCRAAWAYADLAVQQSEENTRKNCGNVGHNWHSDKIKHFQWAIQKTPYSIAVHSHTRRFSLSFCLSDK